ncbi:MAG: amidase [Marinobacter sp.]|nr:amidase [Marinobacter sp.]
MTTTLDMPLHYRSAGDLLNALATLQLSSETLMEATLARLEEVNSKVNAVVSYDREQALAAARAADEQRERGDTLGPLHGLPLTLKDTWEAPGFPCTAGAPALKEYRPEQPADVVQRLTEAGAIIIGKTNVPLYASDIQTYNKLFGYTRNPYNPERTSGGSSGGAAAALAAGITSLEVGSDLAGSIRTPAHFCGVFGHKPSRDLISLRGHIPGPPGSMTQPDLAEAGPMARSTADLIMLLGVIAGPRRQDERSWALSLAPTSLNSLRQARVGLWLEDRHCPIDDELFHAYRHFGDTLAAQGAAVHDANHPLLDLDRIMPAYFNLLGTLLSTGMKPAQRRQMRWVGRLEPWLKHLTTMTVGTGDYARGVNQSVHELAQWHEQREKMRWQIEELFQDIDVLLCPVTPTTAIPHDHSHPFFNRKIKVNGQPRPYMDQFCWIALATLLGLPATSVPIGRTKEGLPYNIQVIGAPGMDLTTLKFSRLLEEKGLAGFKAPEGF